MKLRPKVTCRSRRNGGKLSPRGKPKQWLSVHWHGDMAAEKHRVRHLPPTETSYMTDAGPTSASSGWATLLPARFIDALGFSVARRVDDIRILRERATCTANEPLGLL